MGRFIIKIKDYYLEWSNIVDSPITFGMTLDEFKEYYQEEYGNQGMEGLPKRLQRVEQNGSSSQVYSSLDEFIEGNRAGPDEQPLTLDEIYKAYCLRKSIRDGWEAT